MKCVVGFSERILWTLQVSYGISFRMKETANLQAEIARAEGTFFLAEIPLLLTVCFTAQPFLILKAEVSAGRNG